VEEQKAEQIDPLHRIFVPIERPLSGGGATLKTTDGLKYYKLLDGSLQRAVQKVRGKAARRADKKMRRTCRPSTPR
jgi:hypothetical protein